MLGILSIAGALALLIYFAYRGISVVIIAPLSGSARRAIWPEKHLSWEPIRRCL